MSDNFDYNKDCLHCCLAKAVHDYFERHPDEVMEGEDIMKSIASLIGDIIEELTDGEQQHVVLELIEGVKQRIEDLRERDAQATTH